MTVITVFAVPIAILLAVFSALKLTKRAAFRTRESKAPATPNAPTRTEPRWDRYDRPAYVRLKTPGVALKLATWHAAPRAPASRPIELAPIDPSSPGR